MNKNIFLVEKRSSLNTHRPSLALARLSTLHKEKGDNVHHIIISSDYKIPNVKPDKVYISIIFSWDILKFIEFIKSLLWMYPTLSKDDIVIGGVAPYFMRDFILEQTGIEPVMGCVYDLDHVIPDPEFMDNDTSYLFTMRSCPNNCSWCVVPKIEKENYVISNWKEQIDLSASKIVIMDNNLLAAPFEHRKEVFDYLAEIANSEGTRVPGRRKLRSVEFDGGFDFRHLTEENLEMMKRIRWSRIRLAFDHIAYEKVFDKAMKRLLEAFPKVSSRGVHENIDVFVLYGCPENKDTIEDTLWRTYKLIHYYKVKPYLMRYQPLGSLTYKTYVSPYWEENDLVDIARWANNRRILYKVPSFKYYYGRRLDGKCLASLTQGQREILNQVKVDMKAYDFSKTYQENRDLIQKELDERNNVLTRITKEFEQMEFAI